MNFMSSLEIRSKPIFLGIVKKVPLWKYPQRTQRNPLPGKDLIFFLG